MLEVSKILGHLQINNTQRYAHLSQETLLAAVDAADRHYRDELGSTPGDVIEYN